MFPFWYFYCILFDHLSKYLLMKLSSDPIRLCIKGYVTYYICIGLLSSKNDSCSICSRTLFHNTCSVCTFVLMLCLKSLTVVYLDTFIRTG